MPTKFLYSLFSLILIFVVGCSSEEASGTNAIRKDLYDESLKYYNLMNERVSKVEELSEEEKKAIQAFDTKYVNMLDQLNENERYLSAEIANMWRSLELAHASRLNNDEKGLKKDIDDYVKAKAEASKLLGVRFE
ncbi:hypothetical protein ACFVS2_28225 [Brevibacillus sp. NPDC058079]|uniref:hypothetical protein n=1 Tax=Brevibacillus sp. NPDC058079 TaxID=3346330 RepID=UPI0036DFC18F